MGLEVQGFHAKMLMRGNLQNIEVAYSVQVWPTMGSKGWFTIQRKACITYVLLRTSYSEPFCVSNCVNYVAYVTCVGIGSSSILAYVRKET